MINKRPLLYIALLLSLAMLSTGCETGPLKDVKLFEKKPDATMDEPSASEKTARSAADRKLTRGITHYEEGEHKQALPELQGALDEGLSAQGQVKAHKYLAFIHCAAKREKQCQAEFTMALEIDPSFDLAPAEAGHPVWGKVFRQVKQDMTAKKP